jgi:uncharacterized membrane protein
MLAWAGQARLSARELEGWLRQALVPVEPSPAFARRLRARLVEVRGNGLPSVWSIIGVLAAVTLFTVGVFGLVLRLVLALMSLLALINRRRHGRGRTT